MRDAWGSKFSPQKDEVKKPLIKIENKPKINLIEKPKTILQDLSKIKENNQTPSNNLSTNSVTINKNQTPDKKIDKEHISIEKIFRICLVEKENFLYLKDYYDSLTERNIEKSFRISDLDSILLTLITSNEKVLYLLI